MQKVLYIQYNARAIVIRVEIKNLTLILLLRNSIIWLYQIDPPIKLVRIFGSLVFNPSMHIDFSIEHNARTTIVGVRMKNLKLVLLLLNLLRCLYAIDFAIKLLKISGSLVFILSTQIDLYMQYNPIL